MECRGEVRGPGKGKTIENLVYQTKYAAGVGEQPCGGGQSGWLLTWADLTGSETFTPTLIYAFLTSLPKYQ